MALGFVVLITASFIIIFGGMFFYATEESMRMTDRERSMKAHSFANSCAEVALQELKEDLYYKGESVDIGDEECIASVEDYGFYGKTIMAEGFYFDHTRKIRVDVDTRDWPRLEVVDWQDVGSFEAGR